MTPEARSLIALARGERPENARVDWNRVCELAARHEVDALSFWAWRDLDREAVAAWQLPDSALQRLRMAFLHHSLRNESLARDLGALAEALRNHGADALFLKGPWLAFEAYPSPGTRPIGDVDLCVREQDYGPTVRALEEVGYQAAESLPGTAGAALSRAHHDGQLRFAARGRRPLELHLRMINVGPPRDDEDWVWSTARPLTVAGQTLRVPGPTAMLLHLALHANQHGFSKLRLLFDLRYALSVDRASIDTGLLIDRVETLRCRAAVYYALLLAEELAAAVVPGPLLEALRPRAPRRALYELAWNLRAVRRLDARSLPNALEAPKLYLLELGRSRDKLRYLRGIVREARGGSLLRRAVSASSDRGASPGERA
jgi:hypothetical protein